MKGEGRKTRGQREKKDNEYRTGNDKRRWIRLMVMEKSELTIPKDKIQEFCNRWKITKFSLFGSAIRDDFIPESDVDVLVSFSPDADWSLLDLVHIQDELREILGREVDLVEEAGIRNPFRRHAILGSRKVIYAA